MDIDAIAAAGIVGNVSYDAVKLAINLTVQSFKNKLANAGYSWGVDDATIQRIASRINELSYVEGESKDDYCKRLQNDEHLTNLFDTSTLNYTQHTTTLSGDSATQQIHSGDGCNISHHYHGSPTAAKKKVVCLPAKFERLVGRGNLIDNITNSLKKTDKNVHVLLHGLGGIGKTFICREVCHACALDDGVASILWLSASEGLMQQLRTVAITEFEIDVSSSLWLATFITQLNQCAMPAVLCVDNLDESHDEQYCLNELRKTRWHIVATSRTPISGFDEEKHIQPLSEDECCKLFIHHYMKNVSEVENVSEADKQTINEIIVYCGRHTLLLSMWAKLANRDGLALKDILNTVRQRGFDLRDLSDSSVDAVHVRTENNPQDREQQIARHLELLFDISQIDNDAQMKLRILSILPYEAYETEMLCTWFENALPKDFIALSRRGWLERTNSTFLLHPAIAFVLAQKVELNQSALTSFIYKFLSDTAFSQTEHWNSKSHWAVHLESIMHECEAQTVPHAAVQSRLAILLKSQGLYDKAQPLYESTLATRTRILGPKHHETLTTKSNLAILYKIQGAYDKAQPLYETTLATRYLKFGAEHLDTLTSKQNLASFYESRGSQGDCDKALLLYKNTLATLYRTLGAEHSVTLTTQNNLALLYKSLRDYEKALLLYKATLKTRYLKFGAEHPDTLTSKHNLAGFYVSRGLQGDYDKALLLYETTQATLYRTLGADHPNTLTAQNNLAGLYGKQGLYDKAERLYKATLEIYSRTLAAEHPATLTTQNNLAGLYESRGSQGDYDKALIWYKATLATRYLKFGAEHPDTLTSKHDLAFLYESQDADKKAQSLYESTLAARTRILSAEHEDTLTSMSNLAFLYKKQGSKEALPLHETALETAEKVLGVKNSKTVSIRRSLEALKKLKD